MSQEPEPGMDQAEKEEREREREVVDQCSDNDSNQRLIITKIVCKDFKSYAGVQELGPFHKRFSAIVGPNGSGKSNVIDAMLFVFGYRARKIRSKKISVLIHNSAQHQNIQSCSVSVHFMKILDLPGESYEEVPGSEFVVSRTAFKDNSSHYQLNGRKIPFREVASLLRKSGIDLDHNRFLILQGEVEQIALMKPKAQSENDDGMLEFLEDIIGTSQFKEPIEELAKRVEELNDTRGEKLNRVKAVEKEKNELESAKDEAEHFLALKRDVARKHHMLYQRYIYECQQHEAKAKSRKEELDGQVEKIESTRKEHAASRSEKTKAQKKHLREYEKLVERNEKCKRKLADCEQLDVRLRQDIKNTKNNMKKIKKALGKEKEKLTELEETPLKKQKEIKSLKQKLKILEARKADENAKLLEVMEGLKTATQGLQIEKEQLEAQLVDLNHGVNDTKSKLKVAQVELDIYCEQFTSSSRQMTEAKESLQSIKNTLKDKRKELSMIEKELPAKKKELERTEAELKSSVESEAELQKKVLGSRANVEEAKMSLEARKSRGQVLESLMQQKSQGKIPGIHGRLGDLGAIDEQYDVAISTACGALDHIVVDTMDTAVKCVEFLKKNNIGWATFIALDKIEQWRKHATSKISTPESAPRLFDLVRVGNPAFLTAFYFALRDTLVAKDLQQATRIGLQGQKRYRVVTYGGQMIEISGTMSGGGTKVMKGRMSSRSHVVDLTPGQFSELGRALASDEKALEERKQRRRQLEDRAKELSETISRMKSQLKTLERDIEILDVKEKGLKERLADLEAQSAENKIDPAHQGKLQKQVKQYEKEHSKASEKAGKVQAEVERLHHQIMEIGGSRMQQQQAQVDAISREINETNTAVTKANVAIKTAERNREKCQTKIASSEKELEDLDNLIKEHNESAVKLQEDAEAIVSEQEEMLAVIKKSEAVLVEMKADIEAVDKEEREVQSQLVDLRHELDVYVTKLKENQQKISHFKNEMKKLDFGEDKPSELNQEQLQALEKKSVEYEITMLEEQLKQMTPNMAAIDEYHRKEKIYQERLGELDAITSQRNGVRNEYDDMRKRRLDQFMTGFTSITHKLKEMYQMITLGGDAELELVDSLDPFTEGIVFSVRPPKKSWKNISNLSGGEKTLSSLALVFALHHYKPSPLYVMDEIDAALDFKNVSIIAHYIKERTKNAQFIIISLRNNMFELADRMVGIYKTHDCTKSVTIDPWKLSMGMLTAATTCNA